jgi:hypothetical protein
LLRKTGMNLKPMPVLLALLAGCGSCSTPTTNPDGFNTTPGQTVVAGGITTVIFTSLGGGFHGVPPSGAACDPAQWTYNIGLEYRTLQAKTCKVTGDAADPASYFLDDEPFTLSDAQWMAIDAAVAGVKVSGKTSCGADADQRELTVVSTAGSLTYGDDFYACQTIHQHFVTFDSLSNLEQVLEGIVQP